MSITEILNRPGRLPPAPLAGYWHPVLFSPEPATGERITVGIAFRAPDGTAQFQWLRSFDRLRKVFGADAPKHLPFLMRHAESLVQEGKQPAAPELHFGEVRELYATNAEQALSELFERFVPLARDFGNSLKPYTAVQNRKLRDSVYQILKTSTNTDAAALIPQNPSLRSQDNPPRYLNVPIQGRGRFGALVSAQARNVGTIDRNVYPAVAELNAAAKIHKVKNVAVFLLRPDENSIPEEEYDAIDEHVHQMVFVLRNEGVIVLPEISPQLIAASVQEWGLSR